MFLGKSAPIPMKIDSFLNNLTDAELINLYIVLKRGLDYDDISVRETEEKISKGPSEFRYPNEKLTEEIKNNLILTLTGMFHIDHPRFYKRKS
ncbi:MULTISPECIES: hypothetical protein [Ligilactobacillus]|jgi:hypothetical protein|uniref:Uncharacterized protein n=1 Tax=Ligilactobacillus salivarius TaxID=1624 RepID=A0A7X2MEM1_9LACO|nr:MULTISPECIES: hypothetical protein [Ligilactobacillus]HIS16983.1 hypothetical protein [Candidatus Coprovivens excrementavium]MCZ0744754.1 hypothetical protein [Ligilactobacillus sp. UO.C109]MSE07994.1 hypothetical protein [Ligilactobacillus salivarius]OQQ84498.1 hypothetical protein B6U58_02450 [Ligilactobacillus salivarius]OQQ99541.1 hypothetical protein B6U52_01445 [Ligilactobacillus salivarius]